MFARTTLALLALTTPLFASDGLPSRTATYQVVFDGDWTAVTHPNMFPPGAHFSPIVLASHNDGVAFWETGQLATNGIEVMAETGGTSPLRNEIDAAISAGTAGMRTQGSGSFPSNGQDTLNITVSLDHPLVMLVSMIAPSPDWFVGVNGLDLKPNGDWEDSLTVDLFPYDSGTDSGTTFLSSNQDTQPPELIHAITTLPLGNGVPLGTLTFTRTDNPGLWVDVGNELAGTNGDAMLVGSGPLTGGSTATLDLTNAMPNSRSLLVIGSSAIVTPFAGGTLIPSPDFIFGSTTNGSGALSMSGTWPNGVPSGSTFLFQHWFVDAGGPKGFGASNAVCIVTP